MNDKSQGVIFIAKESINRSQSVLGNSAAYKNQGNVIFGTNSSACKGFKAGDVIGAFIDFGKSEIRFYKNRLLVASFKMDLVSNEAYRFGVMLTQPGQQIDIVDKPQIPDDIDITGIKTALKYGLSAE